MHQVYIALLPSEVMAFESIPPIPNKTILTEALVSKQRAVYSQKRGKKSARSREKQIKEALKSSVDAAADAIEAKVQHAREAFPMFEELSLLYQELIAIVIDVDRWKRNLGALRWLQQQVKTRKREYIRKIAHADATEEAKQWNRAFLGRVASCIKQIGNQLEELETQRKALRKLPTIKDKYPLVVVYGFPNVGKTTMLEKLTGANPEIAPYPFTTKGVNLGHLTNKGKRVQVADSPGTLARPDKQNRFERMAESMIKHADGIVFVVDPTMPLETQLELFNKLPKDLPLTTYVSKKDCVPKEAWGICVAAFMPAGDLKSVKQFITKFID